MDDQHDYESDGDRRLIMGDHVGVPGLHAGVLAVDERSWQDHLECGCDVGCPDVVDPIMDSYFKARLSNAVDSILPTCRYIHGCKPSGDRK